MKARPTARLRRSLRVRRNRARKGSRPGVRWALVTDATIGSPIPAGRLVVQPSRGLHGRRGPIRSPADQTLGRWAGDRAGRWHGARAGIRLRDRAEAFKVGIDPFLGLRERFGR